MRERRIGIRELEANLNTLLHEVRSGTTLVPDRPGPCRRTPHRRVPAPTTPSPARQSPGAAAV